MAAIAKGTLPPTHPHEHLTPMDERKRTLELAKYFEASQIVPPSQGTIGDEEVAAAPSAPAANTTLTALAQLGTFKLACDRAFISLINSTHQYIIGEATQSTSLLNNALRSDDGLCLGVRALEPAFGVCPQTIQLFTSDDRTISTPNLYADKTHYVIKDFTADSHFRSRPYVKGWPHMRSYAEVPLKSASGYVVGSYCVVDTRPRSFDESEIQVLDSVGVTIMNHLELLKSQLEFRRVQRLVRGIGSYAAGYSGLQENQTRPSFGISTPTPLLQLVEEKKSLPLRLARGDFDENITRPAMHRFHTDETIESLSDASLGTTLDSDTTGPTSKPGSSDASEPRADAASMPDRSTSIGLAHGETVSAVSRASHLIRQSMNLGGVVFVEPHANAVTPGSSVTVNTANKQGLGPESPNCAVIGHSVDVHSVQGNESDAYEFTLSHSLLQRLLGRYPFGHVFSYDDLGAVLQPNSGKDGQEKRHPSQANLQCTETLTDLSEAQDAAELLDVAKGARSIAFTTLWDYRNDKWFAASVSWTVDPLRIFDAGELNYLSAFGNSITAEVSRLEVSAVSKAKSDFISSISHEMRSPLHGILAGTEILRDTMKLDAEVSMLNSIDACGSMLLDTINHLLDYSKITNSPRRRQDYPSESFKEVESKANGFPVVNLSTLVHDVVEGVFLGNVASENASDRETSDDTIFTRNLRQVGSDQIALKLTETGDMVTFIDIDPSVDWRFKTEAAAWKRIVMNLFGNAMKFTKKGQITVKLHLARRGSAESETAQHICVEFHDTGSGINEDYLKSHLFAAFSQADDITMGTGVGLSIVKRLVEELNGSIDVQSDEGIGTRVCVAIPLGEMTSPVNGWDSLLYEKVCLYANGRHKGHILYVQSPASNPPKGEHDKSTDTSSSGCSSTTTTTDADANMQTFFANLAREGFGMSVVVVGSPDNDQKQSDASFHSISLNSSTPGGAWTLCSPAHADSDNAADVSSNCTVVSIRQPFSSRTFASALDEIMAFSAAGAETVDTSVTSIEAEREQGIQSLSPPRTSPPAVEGHASSPDHQDQHTAAASETRDMAALTQESNHIVPERDTTPSREKTGPHLLLVDDNAVNLKVLAASVKRVGCTFDQATDGRQAVEAFKSSPSAYDLVFMDLSMPVLDGIEATREIREFEKECAGCGSWKRAQIIALTALDDEKHRQRAFDVGVDYYINKPVKMARVRELAKKAWGG